MSYYFLSLSFDPPHPYMTHPTPPYPTQPLHDPPTPPYPTPQPQNKGPGMLWGQSYVLPMTCRGGWRHWAPLSVDMQPYGCFTEILKTSIINYTISLEDFSTCTGILIVNIYFNSKCFFLSVAIRLVIKICYLAKSDWENGCKGVNGYLWRIQEPRNRMLCECALDLIKSVPRHKLVLKQYIYKQLMLHNFG